MNTYLGYVIILFICTKLQSMPIISASGLASNEYANEVQNIPTADALFD